MTYGMIISTVVTEPKDAVQMSLGSFFPVFLLSGILWPIQGIPVPLVYLSYVLPTTWGGSIVQSVMTRGWGLDVESVR
jgi:ABC-type multidrug transport system permease subunit